MLLTLSTAAHSLHWGMHPTLAALADSGWVLLCTMPTSSQLSTRARSFAPTPSRCPALSWYLMARYLQGGSTKLWSTCGLHQEERSS